ncbi:MAG: GNAT family N-acetyltransferase [Clostridia bacterium]|nr:GNAT family N-acetyltransferase [Clostridia bacterium]
MDKKDLGGAWRDGLAAAATMKLADMPFRLIKEGKKTVEVRLCDEKRRLLRVGDIVAFSRVNARKEKLFVKITMLKKFTSFFELFSSPLGDAAGKGEMSSEAAARSMYEYYSPENEAALGVLAIGFELLSQEGGGDIVVIREFDEKFAEDVKNLMVELQEHLAKLDTRGVLVLKEGYKEAYYEFLLKECEKHAGKIFIAEEGGKAVGCVVAKIFDDGDEEEKLTTTCPKIGFISDLIVTEYRRGGGIGKRLIAAAERYFKNSGCKYTQLTVFAPNEKAFELYKKLGFKVNHMYLSKETDI